MGLLRFFLAVGVIFHHVRSDIYLINGGFAVEIFFIISGFYMALILNGKYKNRLSVFYSNRALRIFPLYILTFVLQFLTMALLNANVYMAREKWFFFFSSARLDSIPLLFSNLFIFGQELSPFFGVGNGLNLVYDAQSQIMTRAWQYLLVPQAWSIALELLFYLFAPFLTKRRKILTALFILSWLLHKYILWGGNDYNTWGRRFFLSEWHYFLLGMLVFYVSQPFAEGIKHRFSPFLARLTLLPLFGGLLLFSEPTYYVRLAAYPIISLYCAFIIPILFYSNATAWDYMLGEMSYPVYILHILFIGISERVLGLSNLPSLAFVVATTLAASWLVVKFFDAPIERYRQLRAAV